MSRVSLIYRWAIMYVVVSIGDLILQYCFYYGYDMYNVVRHNFDTV